MYTPALFKVENVAEAHALMRGRPFATLVTNGSEGLTATHLPTVLKTDGCRAAGTHRMPRRATQSAVENVRVGYGCAGDL